MYPLDNDVTTFLSESIRIKEQPPKELLKREKEKSYSPINSTNLWNESNRIRANEFYSLVNLFYHFRAGGFGVYIYIQSVQAGNINRDNPAAGYRNNEACL